MSIARTVARAGIANPITPAATARMACSHTSFPWIGTSPNAVCVAGIYPGFSVHDEMTLLVRDVGLSPFDALKAATINPARAMKLQGEVGSVVPGQRADMVLLAANPLDDNANTTRIDAVIVDGRMFDRSAIESLLAGAAAALRAEPNR